MKNEEKASFSIIKIICVSIILILISGISVMAVGTNFNDVTIVLQNGYELTAMTSKAKVSDILEENSIVLDLFAGSGAIGISIAKYVKNVNVTMTDISTQALNIAKKNAMQNGVEGKVTLLLSNLWEEIPKIKFDCIVSNPPYIETSVIEKLSNEVKSEPRIALDGGNDGLFFYKEILKNAFQFLKPEGYLLLEIGYDQGKKVIDLWKEKNTVLELITKDPIKDFANNDRVIIFKKIKQ